MPDATTHRAGAALAMTLLSVLTEKQDTPNVGQYTCASSLAYLLGTLPDLIEPASNPNHRQFFHSWICLALVGYGTYKAYRWQPETKLHKLVKGLLITGGIAYSTHLLMDSTTPKGLPAI